MYEHPFPNLRPCPLNCGFNSGHHNGIHQDPVRIAEWFTLAASPPVPICDCTRAHSVSAHSPTGHAVTCPAAREVI